MTIKVQYLARLYSNYIVTNERSQPPRFAAVRNFSLAALFLFRFLFSRRSCSKFKLLRCLLDFILFLIFVCHIINLLGTQAKVHLALCVVQYIA